MAAFVATAVYRLEQDSASPGNKFHTRKWSLLFGEQNSFFYYCKATEECFVWQGHKTGRWNACEICCTSRTATSYFWELLLSKRVDNRPTKFRCQAFLPYTLTRLTLLAISSGWCRFLSTNFFLCDSLEYNCENWFCTKSSIFWSENTVPPLPFFKHQNQICTRRCS